MPKPKELFNRHKKLLDSATGLVHLVLPGRTIFRCEDNEDGLYIHEADLRATRSRATCVRCIAAEEDP